MTVLREDPYADFNFLVSLGGGDPRAAAGGFSEVSGLGIEITYVEYRNGNDRTNGPRRIPTSHRHDDLVLRRGVIGATDLFEWLSQARDGVPSPRDVTVTLLDDGRQPVMTWRLRGAQPKRWTGPALKGIGSNVAIEELVLVYEGIDIG